MGRAAFKINTTQVKNMTIEIVSVGNEILSGNTVNTNASWIAKSLHSSGFKVDGIITLPDNCALLKAGLFETMKRARYIIVTGGLGPTLDDVTRSVLADIFKTPLIFNQELETHLIKRYGAKFEALYSFKDQSTLPKGAEIIPNFLGTAPGFILKNQETAIFALPGVPAQMKAMFLDGVLPFLKKNVSQTNHERALFLCQLSEMEVDPYLRELEKEFPGVEIGICPSYGILSIYLSAKDKNEDLEGVQKAIEKKFPTHVFSTKSKCIEKAVHQTLINQKKSLALAESCTGGSLSAGLTEISGASNYFLGSIVSYSDHIKKSVLGVSSNTLKEYGAVSKPVVEQMIKGVLKVSGADFALAVSGIAGPDGGSKEKPVGTVWSGLGTKEGDLYVGHIQAKGVGSRETVIEYTRNFMLSSFWRYLTHQTPPFNHDA